MVTVLGDKFGPLPVGPPTLPIDDRRLGSDYAVRVLAPGRVGDLAVPEKENFDRAAQPLGQFSSRRAHAFAGC
jgi:hypothetical protein